MVHTSGRNRGGFSLTKPLCWIRMVKGFLQNNAPDLRDKQANQPTVILLTGNSCEGIEQL